MLTSEAAFTERVFPLASVLTVVTGRWLTDWDSVLEILSFMINGAVNTYKLGEITRAVGEEVIRQHPVFTEVKDWILEEGESTEDWLAEWRGRYDDCYSLMRNPALHYLKGSGCPVGLKGTSGSKSEWLVNSSPH